MNNEQVYQFNFKFLINNILSNKLDKLFINQNISIIFKTDHNNNNLLYIDYILTKYYNINLSNFYLFKLDKSFKLSNDIETTQRITDDCNIHIYKYNDLYFIDLKKIKYSAYTLLFNILDYIIKTDKLFNIDKKSIIIINTIDNVIGYYLSALSNYIEKNYYNVQFLFFTNKINKLKQHKLLQLCQIYNLNINKDNLLHTLYINKFINENIKLCLQNSPINLEKHKILNVKNQISKYYNKHINNILSILIKYLKNDIIKCYILIKIYIKQYLLNNNIKFKYNENKTLLIQNGNSHKYNIYKAYLQNKEKPLFILNNILLNIPITNIMYNLLTKIKKIKKINNMDIVYTFSYKIISLPVSITYSITEILNIITYIHYNKLTNNLLYFNYDKIFKILTLSAEIEYNSIGMDKPVVNLQHYLINLIKIIL